MSPLSTRLHLFERISKNGTEMISCTHCARAKLSCILSPDSKCCAYCVKSAKPCDCLGVSLSAWKSVDNALERLHREETEALQAVEKAAEASALAHARLVRVRKLKKFQKQQESDLMRQDALSLDELDAAMAESSPSSDPLDSLAWESLDLPVDFQSLEPSLGN